MKRPTAVALFESGVSPPRDKKMDEKKRAPDAGLTAALRAFLVWGIADDASPHRCEGSPSVASPVLPTAWSELGPVLGGAQGVSRSVFGCVIHYSMSVGLRRTA